jgi:Site-specific recombinase XerD
MQLIHLLDEFLLELKLANKSDRTIKSVKNNCLLFFKYAEHEFNIDSIEQLNRNHIKAYIKYKQSLGLKATYINSIMKNLRMYFNYLYQEEYISNNFIMRIKFQIHGITIYACSKTSFWGLIWTITRRLIICARV